MRNSVVAHGVLGYVSSGGVLNLENCEAFGLEEGLRVFSNGVGRISNCTFTGNQYGVVNNGTLYSFGNNKSHGNTFDYSGTAVTPVPPF